VALRKDTLTRTVEWWKHLKWRKRDQASQAAKRDIKERLP
jgi:hypothetical protein